MDRSVLLIMGEFGYLPTVLSTDQLAGIFILLNLRALSMQSTAREISYERAVEKSPMTCTNASNSCSF